MEEVIDIKPLSVKAMGRTQMACLRCRSQKMRCSKEQPSCKTCNITNRQCEYPKRERKLVLLDSQFQKLQDRIKYLESELKKKGQNDGIKIEEYIDPFDKEVGDKTYFGSAACQTFDSSLNSFLFRFTHNSNVEVPDNNLRYFLQDTSANKSFLGVLMLPDKDYAIFLIQKVIEFLGHEYYFIDTEEIFNKLDKTYSSMDDRDPLWCCYLLTVLAVGEQYLNESPDGGVPGMRFFIPAMQFFRNYYENPNLELIQTLLLFGFYQQGLNRINAAFTFYGLAIRNSLLMGLHKKITANRMSKYEKEKRKRVWWTCFILDSVWSAKLGHPMHILIEDTDAELPNENVVTLNDEFDYEILTLNVKLGTILDRIMKSIYRTNPISLKNIVECLEELDKFQRSFPPRIKKSLFSTSNRGSANLYLRLNQAVIITTRPLVLSIFKGIIVENEVTNKVIQKCTIAAKTTIDILLHLKQNGWVSTFGFWDAQYVFSSLLILIMSNLSGYKFEQIEIGRELNGYMKAAGNFTAMENDIRLRKLDQLLQDVRDQTKLKLNDSSNTERENSDANDPTSNINDNDSIDDNNDDKYNNHHPPVEKQLHNLLPETKIPATKLSDGGPNINFSPPSNAALSHHSLQISEPSFQHNNEPHQQVANEESTIMNEILSNFTPTEFNYHDTEVINLFKEDTQDSAWNSLILNLQFWDSSVDL